MTKKLETSTWFLVKFQNNKTTENEKNAINNDTDVTRPRVLRWKYARVISLDSFQAHVENDLPFLCLPYPDIATYMTIYGYIIYVYIHIHNNTCIYQMPSAPRVRVDFQISCLAAIAYCHPCPFLQIPPPVGVGQRTPQLLFDSGGPGCTIGLRHGRSKKEMGRGDPKRDW